MPSNVFGDPLQACCFRPNTGFYRDGYCRTGPDDRGLHTVCAVMTEEFLRYSKATGNDLTTPMPEYAFPGLKPGDRWCLLAPRWAEALEAGQAPRVVLAATHQSVLHHVEIDVLKRYAVE